MGRQLPASSNPSICIYLHLCIFDTQDSTDRIRSRLRVQTSIIEHGQRQSGDQNMRHVAADAAGRVRGRGRGNPDVLRRERDRRIRQERVREEGACGVVVAPACWFDRSILYATHTQLALFLSLSHSHTFSLSLSLSLSLSPLSLSLSIYLLHTQQYKGLWHCFVGRNFGAFVTHEQDKFSYFYIGQIGFLLFSTV